MFSQLECFCLQKIEGSLYLVVASKPFLIKPEILNQNIMFSRKSISGKALQPMKSILERFDLLDEQSGAGSGTKLKCNGDILKAISPIDKQLIGTIRCATDKEYQQIIVQAAKAFKTWRLVPAPARGEIVRQIGEKPFAATKKNWWERLSAVINDGSTVLLQYSRLKAAPTKVDSPVNQSVALVIICHIRLSAFLLPRRGHFSRT
jgi:hypothetical protein